MAKSTFYHAGCPVCVNAEEELLNLMDKSQVDVVHLGQAQDRIPDAEQAGVKSVPALVTPTGNVLHINYGASMADVKGWSNGGCPITDIRHSFKSVMMGCLRQLVPFIDDKPLKMAEHVAIFDTYVKRPSGPTMHFDIVVPAALEPKKVYEFGLEYLKSKQVETSHFSTKLCNFCHLEVPTDLMKKDIREKGFHIIEMEGCH